MKEKCELIDMFKNIIFPKQAEDLLKINYEGLGELDKQEYLRDTSILIKLAEKGLKYEQEPRWIPMIRREPTDEEKVEYLAQNGEELCYMIENEMPLNGQEVLVSIGEMVSEDVFEEDFYNFENNDIENVNAWMPLPKPYKKESEDRE